MAIRKHISRFYSILPMLLMFVLAIGTFAIAAEEKWDIGGSYSLIIQKQFDIKTSKDVLAAAQGKEYTFKITGTRKNKAGEMIEIDETFTLPRKDANGKAIWESQTYTSDGPFDVTVTEITDNIVLEVDGQHYNMSDSSTDAAASVNSRKHEVELRNNSTLTITRPAAAQAEKTEPTLWYHLTSRQEDDHDASNFRKIDEVFSLSAGEKKEFGKSPGKLLRAGIYTIEQIAAPDGYRVQLGERTQDVGINGNTETEGHFYINGNPGKLTLTAGGVQGDGATHYYTVERTEKEEEDNSEFQTRTILVDSGEDCVLEDLPKGGYTVKEFSLTGNANTAFSVMMTRTDEKSRTALSSAPQYTNFRTFTLAEGTTYFKLNSWGPLYDASKKAIEDTNITYDFAYGWGNEKSGITYLNVQGDFNAKGTYSLNNPTKRYPATPKIGFKTQNVSDPKAKYIGVAWTEYTEKDVTTNFEKAGIQYKNGLTVDDRGKMTIQAPVLKKGSDTNQIVYYYAIRNNKDKLVTFDENATDKEDTSIKLKAGESRQLTVPAGSYKITETVEWENVGFTMKVEGYEFGTTEAGKTTAIQVGGNRTVTITKPAAVNLPDGAEDNRDYTFTISGGSSPETVTLKAGEKQIVTLPKAGQYTITPQNDTLETYELNYSDSSAIYGTASGHTSTVTFTNTFNEGDYAYRYIHEYYLKNPDGSYTYEGNSQITTARGRPQGEIYQAGNISKAVDYKGGKYTHFDESYGWVTPLSPESSQNVTVDTNARTPDDTPFTSKYQGILTNGGTGTANTDTGTRKIEYAPVAGWTETQVTTDAREIVILRYYREAQPRGDYKVIHEYYLRDQDGDHWEGTTGVENVQAELDIEYTEKMWTRSLILGIRIILGIIGPSMALYPAPTKQTDILVKKRFMKLTRIGHS